MGLAYSLLADGATGCRMAHELPPGTIAQELGVRYPACPRYFAGRSLERAICLITLLRGDLYSAPGTAGGLPDLGILAQIDGRALVLPCHQSNRQSGPGLLGRYACWARLLA